VRQKVPPIDRGKLRTAIRKLGDEYVFYMLDEAIELLPPAKPARLVGRYLDVKQLQPNADRGRSLFAGVKELRRSQQAHAPSSPSAIASLIVAWRTHPGATPPRAAKPWT